MIVYNLYLKLIPETTLRHTRKKHNNLYLFGFQFCIINVSVKFIAIFFSKRSFRQNDKNFWSDDLMTTN